MLEEEEAGREGLEVCETRGAVDTLLAVARSWRLWVVGCLMVIYGLLWWVSSVTIPNSESLTVTYVSRYN